MAGDNGCAKVDQPLFLSLQMWKLKNIKLVPTGRGYGDNSQEVIIPGKLQKRHPILFDGPIEPGKTSQKKTTANKRKTISEKCL